MLSVDELADRVIPYLQAAQLLGDEVTPNDRETLSAAAPLIHERMTTLAESVGMIGFLFVPDEAFRIDPADEAKLLDESGRQVVQTAYDAVSGLGTWDTPSIEDALRASLIEGLGLKPRNAFRPVRVAITGRRVSPPLFESMELLGRDRSLARLASVTEPN
jgi:glutamyl-tRNA synthetase